MGKMYSHLLGGKCFEEMDFRSNDKKIMQILSDLSYLKPMLKEILLLKQMLLVLQKEKNITPRDSRAREIMVTFLETTHTLFARRLINFSQILKLVSHYPNKSFKYYIWLPD